jgi:hypothetical protein
MAPGLPSGITTGTLPSMARDHSLDFGASIPADGELRDTVGKVRENQLRRVAERQGLKLVKSRRRDPRAIGYGGYMIVDARTNAAVWGEIDSARSLDLDAVESYLLKGFWNTLLMT